MTWVETTSASFRARHDSGDGEDAQRVLMSLERTRAQLTPLFARTPDQITVILHGGSIALALTNPLLPLSWLATRPDARRYVAGWAGQHELHVLSPAALRERASGVTGSRAMLYRTAACLYALRVIHENNPDLARVAGPIRVARVVRWAWLIEGSARWFGGQTEHARPAIARLLRGGARPSFPPGVRDAPLLGQTVIDLLARRHGPRAAARFTNRLHPQGPRAALSRAFGQSLVSVEGDWRAHLAELAGSAQYD